MLTINEQLTDDSGGTIAPGTAIYFGSNFPKFGNKVTVSIFGYKTEQLALNGASDYVFSELKNSQYSFEKNLDASFWLDPLTNLHNMVKDWIVSKSLENGTPILASNIVINLPK